MTKKRGKARAQGITVLLRVTPHGIRAKRLVQDPVYASTAMSGRLLVLCGFSNTVDITSAFRWTDDHVKSLIEQWTDTNGRGWRFELTDLEGQVITAVKL